MAQVWRHPRTIAAALSGLAALTFVPALAQDQGTNGPTDLYDRPVLAVDPGMHTAKIWSQAVDAEGRFAVTGGADRTVRIWSVADGKLLRTIWIPVGPDPVGAIYAVAISPDGSTVAAGGYTEALHGDSPIYVFDRESGNLIRRIAGDLPEVTHFLTFSPDGRYLAATLGGTNGLRVFDRDKDWSEVFRDDQYGDQSYGATFARGGRLATTSYDARIRLYAYALHSNNPGFRPVGEPVQALSGHLPFRIAFSPDGKRLALGYLDVAKVDILNGNTLKREGGQTPPDLVPTTALAYVAWSPNGQTLFAAGTATDSKGRRLMFAWDAGGRGDERRMTYCGTDAAAGVNALPEGRIFVASLAPCLSLNDIRGQPIWTTGSPICDFRSQDRWS